MITMNTLKFCNVYKYESHLLKNTLLWRPIRCSRTRKLPGLKCVASNTDYYTIALFKRSIQI